MGDLEHFFTVTRKDKYWAKGWFSRVGPSPLCISLSGWPVISYMICQGKIVLWLGQFLWLGQLIVTAIVLAAFLHAAKKKKWRSFWFNEHIARRNWILSLFKFMLCFTKPVWLFNATGKFRSEALGFSPRFCSLRKHHRLNTFHMSLTFLVELYIYFKST